MTLEEKLYLLILEKFIQNPKPLLQEDYKRLVKEIIDDNENFLINALVSKGYLKGGNNYIDERFPIPVHKIVITHIGEKAYFDLKKRKRIESSKTIAFWVTLTAAIISAIFAILTYCQNGDV